MARFSGCVVAAAVKCQTRHYTVVQATGSPYAADNQCISLVIPCLTATLPRLVPSHTLLRVIPPPPTAAADFSSSSKFQQHQQMSNRLAMRQLLGCNVYVSEGRNMQLIRTLEALCQQRPSAVVLAHSFVDGPYNRTGLTLAATSINELAATVTDVARHVLAHIDLSKHDAQHPRLGALDHVSLHPLGADASLALAAQAACAIGQQLAQPPLQLPVYFYGAAHPAYRRLADIRRRLGYFTPSSQQADNNSSGSNGSSSSSSGAGDAWHGSIRQLQLSAYPPDAGPSSASAAAGVVCVGAVPWVTNFNIPLYTQDMAAAKAVAKAVSTKGGGPPGVEVMALPHGPGVIEVATNLVAYDWRKAGGAGGAGAAAASTETAPPTAPPEQHQSSRGLGSGSTLDAGQDSSSGATSNLLEQHALHSSWGRLDGAGPAEVAAAVAKQAQLHGLPPPGQGYITNRAPQELIAFAAEHLQHCNCS